MKTNRIQRILLCCGLAGVVALVFWQRFCRHSGPVTAGAFPPTERLRAFSPTNAPTTPANGQWKTNQPVDPLNARFLQQVAASVRAKQTPSAPANTSTLAAGFR